VAARSRQFVYGKRVEPVQLASHGDPLSIALTPTLTPTRLADLGEQMGTVANYCRAKFPDFPGVWLTSTDYG
jgi:hypothetical protein